jgi:hypothetical protein
MVSSRFRIVDNPQIYRLAEKPVTPSTDYFFYGTKIRGMLCIISRSTLYVRLWFFCVLVTFFLCTDLISHDSSARTKWNNVASVRPLRTYLTIGPQRWPCHGDIFLRHRRGVNFLRTPRFLPRHQFRHLNTKRYQPVEPPISIECPSGIDGLASQCRNKQICYCSGGDTEPLPFRNWIPQQM